MLSENLKREIRNHFSDKFTQPGVYVFRRIAKVMPGKLVKAIKYENGASEGEEVELSKLASGERERYVDVFHKSYGCLTSKHQMRKETHTENKVIYLSKNTCQYVDLFGDKIFGDIYSNSPTPIVGDLVFIFVSFKTLSNLKKGSDIRADMWSVVSDQFLRTYTALFNDWDDTFDAIVGKVARSLPREQKEDVFKRKTLMGNMVIPNTYQKYLNTVKDENVEPVGLKEKFWKLRSEPASRSIYMDKYAALLVMVRWGEAITNDNVPIYSITENGITSEKRRWYLPTTFMSDLLDDMGISTDVEQRNKFLETEIVGLDALKRKYPAEKNLSRLLDLVACSKKENVVPSKTENVIAPITEDVSAPKNESEESPDKFTFRLEVPDCKDWESLANADEDEWS